LRESTVSLCVAVCSNGRSHETHRGRGTAIYNSYVLTLSICSNIATSTPYNSSLRHWFLCLYNHFSSRRRQRTRYRYKFQLGFFYIRLDLSYYHLRTPLSLDRFTRPHPLTTTTSRLPGFEWHPKTEFYRP